MRRRRNVAVGGGMIPIVTTLLLAVLIGAALFYLVPIITSHQGKTYNKPTHVIVGLDLSQSNPLVTDEAYARKVGKWLQRTIEGLPLASRVTMRTFGAYDATQNRLQIDRLISKRDPADQVGETVGGIVAGIPVLVDRGQIEAQARTNILAFMDNMSRVVDCREGPTEYFLVTDGIEDSEYARLKDPDDSLPLPEYDKPSHAPFYRCQALVLLGLGQGTGSPQATQRLREEWMHWAEAVGFKEFQGLHDW